MAFQEKSKKSDLGFRNVEDAWNEEVTVKTACARCLLFVPPDPLSFTFLCVSESWPCGLPPSLCRLWLGSVRGRHHGEPGVLEADEVGFIPPGCCELAASVCKASSPPTTTFPNGSKQSLRAQSVKDPFCNQPHRYCIISKLRPVSLLTFPQITSQCYVFPAGTLINKWTN